MPTHECTQTRARASSVHGAPSCLCVFLSACGEHPTAPDDAPRVQALAVPPPRTTPAVATTTAPRPPALSTTPTSDLLPCAENTSTKGPPCQACAIIFPLRQSASTVQHCLRSRETAQPEHFVSRWRRPRCSHLPCAAAASAQGQLRDSSALP